MPSANVDFYAGVLGLRLVKKTVNFDAPEAFTTSTSATRQGRPGSILTWFEFAGAPRGRAGLGMIPHAPARAWHPRRRRSTSGLDRLSGRRLRRRARRELSPPLRGLRRPAASSSSSSSTWSRRCARRASRDPSPSTRSSRLEGARAYSPSTLACPRERAHRPARVHVPRRGRVLVSRETDRRFRWAYDPRAGRIRPPGRRERPPHRLGDARRRPGSTGSSAPCRRARDGPPVQDRDYFSRIYFREPRGVLFEIASHARPRLRGRRGPRPTSARSCGCRASRSTCARSLRRRCGPSTNPRPRVLTASDCDLITPRALRRLGRPAGLLVLHHGRGVATS